MCVGRQKGIEIKGEKSNKMYFEKPIEKKKGIDKRDRRGKIEVS